MVCTPFRQKIKDPQPDGLSHKQCFADLATGLATFQVDDETAPNTRGKRHVILVHIEGFSAIADELAEAKGMLTSKLVFCGLSDHRRGNFDFDVPVREHIS